MSEFAQHISKAFEAGEDTPDLYAYHGTAIEAIEYGVEHGRLPVTGGWGREFFIIPRGAPSEYSNYEHAVHYADLNADKFHARTALYPRFQKMNLAVVTNFLLEPELFQPLRSNNKRRNFLAMLRRSGVKEHEMEEAFRERLQLGKGGVVLLLSHRVAQDFPIIDGYDPAEKRVIVPEGLPISYISGIDPLGDYEYDFLSKIQQEADLIS